MIWYLLFIFCGLVVGFFVGRWHMDRELAKMMNERILMITRTAEDAILKQRIEKNKAEADLLLSKVNLEEKDD
ncbi:hypothetical protein L6259_04270 [Candidatus Parcubacteria bacterium]|nr:hypothetical protein [Patescibacteria group bacterium]MCG2694454.1 hypothetical protein [Candidatus Parcubacteria bacterium]